jgi:integrase
VLLSTGANPLYVAKQMGHRDTEMITRKYGRWIELGHDDATRVRLAEFFAQISPKAVGKSSEPL